MRSARHLRKFLEEQGIACETIAERANSATRCARRSAAVGVGANSPILLMGHRDTVFPEGRADAAAVQDRGRQRLRAGRRRHEGRSGDELRSCWPRSRNSAARRRRWSACSPATRRSARRACRPMIEAEARRARAVFNSEPGRPSGNCRDRPQGRRVHALRDHRQGGAFGRQLQRRHQRDRGTGAQDRRAARASPISTQGHHAQCRRWSSGGQTVNTVAPWAECEIDLRFITPADRDAAMAKIERIVGDELCAGHQREARDRRRVPAAGRDAAGQGAVRALRGLRQGARHARSKANSPAAAPIPALPPRSARRRSARSVRSAARRTRPRNIWRSTRWCRARRRWRSRSRG